ncbi:MAG: septum formation initiator family protein [Bacteroidaceae bacterium]|nr:septum formation initiator family protein [Candidatus Equimonas faecalis]MCQ2205393.1 septum formation initiator family protein [Bacteroidaceae bacterium]
MSERIQGLWHLIRRHKYIWTILLFVLIAGFLDENSLWRFFQLRRHNDDLKEEIALYEQEYKEVSNELLRLKQSPRAYEELARVRLYMKSDDEDVYVIE